MMVSRYLGFGSAPRGKMLGALVVLVLSAIVAASPILQTTEGPGDDDYHWVDTWTSMPQEVESSNMPPSPYVGFVPTLVLLVCVSNRILVQGGGGATFKDATLRQTLHMSIGAERIRIQFTNTFGGSDLPITAASIALPAGTKVGVNSIDTATLAGLTFKGAASVTIPRGQVVYSDPINFKVAPQSMLAVTLYSQAGQGSNKITGHPGSRTTSWMGTGNKVNESTVTGASVKHWYIILTRR